MSTEPQEPLHIVRLKVSNIKGIEAAHITPDGAVVHITGKNGAGKSTILDCIQYVLDSARSQPPLPVRKGAKVGQIELDAGPFTATRRWPKGNKSGKGTLVVEHKDGTPIAGPRAFLEELVGPIAFDPGLFLSMSPKEQAKVLREVAGLDFTKIDEQRAALYAARTQSGHEVTRLKGVVQSLPEVQAPDQEVDPQQLAARLAQAIEMDSGNQLAVEAAERTGKALAAQQTAFAEAQKEHQRAIEQSQKRLDVAAAQLETTDRLFVQARDKAKNPTPIEPSVESLRAQLKAAGDTNALVRAKQERVKAERQLGAAIEAQDDKTALISTCDQQKEQLLAEAKWPVAGLGFNDDGVTFNGQPFEQASSAEQLRTAVAMGMANKHRMRVILMREGGHFDSESLAMVQDMAAEHGVQVWLETPSDGDGPPGAIVIEDGHVKEEEDVSA